jgi:hypothetical protein
MDNLTFNKIREAVDKYSNIAIAAPKDPTVDEMGAALGLYLSLEDLGKSLSIATPNTPLVEVSSLVAIDEVKTTLGVESGDLVVSFPYREGEIEKVSYTRDDNFLNIVVKAGEKGLNFDQKDVQFTRGTNAPELLFIVGAAKVSDLGKLFDPTALKDTIVVNIDNKSDNQGFGDIVLTSTKFSSVSEIIANVIFSTGLKMDLDIAQNLMLGIATATNNFQDAQTSSLAFEMAGVLMRNGALRPSSPTSNSRRKLTADFDEEEKPFSGEASFEQNPFGVKTPGELERQPRPDAKPRYMPPAQPKIAQPQPQIQSQPKPVIQPQVEDNNPPEDWLEPKIYKGSTNF